MMKISVEKRDVPYEEFRVFPRLMMSKDGNCIKLFLDQYQGLTFIRNGDQWARRVDLHYEEATARTINLTSITNNQYWVPFYGTISLTE